ncbi:MAG: hypothetical protein QXH96_01780, partial [Candidatus Geothermarchaeota archaeon]
TLISSYGGRIKEVRRFGRLLFVVTNLSPELIKHITLRSSNIKRAYLIYASTETPSYENVLVQELYDEIRTASKIAVGIVTYESEFIKANEVNELRVKVADKLLKDFKGTVDLKNPQKRIVLIYVRDRIFSALELVGDHEKGFLKRRPSKKPVFSPFSLDPKLARVMVNLSGAIEGELILDPFCGVGGIPVEAVMMNIECICIELMYKWALGAEINLRWIDKSRGLYEVICGDSLTSLIRKAKYIVTDPPYGRITTKGRYTEVAIIMDKFLEYASTLDRIHRIVFMHPSSLDIDIEKYYFKDLFKAEIPVHSGLTRILRVVEKK